MQIVIGMDEEKYKWLKEHIPKADKNSIVGAVVNGIPLPNGHGRLIILSEDAVKREQIFLGFSCQSWIGDVGLSNATVAIIEADRSEEK